MRYPVMNLGQMMPSVTGGSFPPPATDPWTNLVKDRAAKMCSAAKDYKGTNDPDGKNRAADAFYRAMSSPEGSVTMSSTAMTQFALEAWKQCPELQSTITKLAQPDINQQRRKEDEQRRKVATSTGMAPTYAPVATESAQALPSVATEFTRAQPFTIPPAHVSTPGAAQAATVAPTAGPTSYPMYPYPTNIPETPSPASLISPEPTQYISPHTFPAESGVPQPPVSACPEGESLNPDPPPACLPGVPTGDTGYRPGGGFNPFGSIFGGGFDAGGAGASAISLTGRLGQVRLMRASAPYMGRGFIGPMPARSPW